MASIDLHIDIPWQCHRQQRALDLEAGCRSVQTDFPRMKEGGLDKFVAALYISDLQQDVLGPDKSWNAIKTQWNHLKQWNPDRIYFGIEGGRLINGSLARINELSLMGVLYFGLTHNSNTSWADSATDDLTHNGLTAVGKSLVKQIQAMNILVDLSHSSDQTVLDVLDLTTKPVIASHSGVRSLVDHPRNLSDALIKLIAKTGGVIGVPYASRFVKDADGVVLAIDHIAQLLGTTRNIAIGSDLDGAATVIEDVRQWSEVLAPLTDIGYTVDDITGIKGGNFLRVLEERNGTKST